MQGIDSSGNLYEERDPGEHGDGVMRRLQESGAHTDGVVAYDMAMKLVNAERAKPAPVEEVDEPASLFDHARSALRKLSGHARDDFARGLLVHLPRVERASVEDVAVEDDWRFAEEVMGEDEIPA